MANALRAASRSPKQQWGGTNTAELGYVPDRFITSDLLECCEHALDILDDSVVTVRALLEAERTTHALSADALAELERHCTALAVGATTLRKRLVRFRKELTRDQDA